MSNFPAHITPTLRIKCSTLLALATGPPKFLPTDLINKEAEILQMRQRRAISIYFGLKRN